MGRDAGKVPSKPLFERLGRGGAAAFAKKINASEQRIANWKRRGYIPAGEVGRVAAALGITYEQYMREAGALADRVAEPGGQYTFERAQLLEDFEALPPWLQEHIARKTVELRRYAESLPPFVRDGMKAPPKDAAAYAAWELEIVADMERRRNAADNGDVPIRRALPESSELKKLHRESPTERVSRPVQRRPRR